MVTATAYNSVPAQTGRRADVTAWGHRLKPGMRVVAVSQDLIALGLGHRVRLRIDGLAGEYVVLDRLPSRWKRRIDIYMGTNVGRALKWGKRRVRIEWDPSAPTRGGAALTDSSD